MMPVSRIGGTVKLDRSGKEDDMSGIPGGGSGIPQRSDHEMSEMSGDLSSIAAPGDEDSRLVGFVIFGAVIMMMIGAFEVLMGATALFDSGYYPVEEEGLFVVGDYAVWGWAHILLGALMIATGIGLFRAKMWARVVGIGLSMVVAVVNMGFADAAPIWSITVIALCVMVIYAIAMHGGDLKEW